MTDIQGIDEVIKDLGDYKIKANTEISGIIAATALGVESDAVKSIQRGTKTGIKSKKHKPNRVHRASAAGEAPASDTGNLASSIKAIIRNDYAIVGTDQDYGFYLEFGTQSILERPWLRPARDKNEKKFRKDIIKALRRIT